ncbi:MAG: hypothetical protein ACE14M_05105 [Terriglobales bacterium]
MSREPMTWRDKLPPDPDPEPKYIPPNVTQCEHAPKFRTTGLCDECWHASLDQVVMQNFAERQTQNARHDYHVRRAAWEARREEEDQKRVAFMAKTLAEARERENERRADGGYNPNSFRGPGMTTR